MLNSTRTAVVAGTAAAIAAVVTGVTAGLQTEHVRETKDPWMHVLRGGLIAGVGAAMLVGSQVAHSKQSHGIAGTLSLLGATTAAVGIGDVVGGALGTHVS